MLTALAGTAAVAGSGKGITAATLTGSDLTPAQLNNLLSNAPTVAGRPKAYIKSFSRNVYTDFVELGWCFDGFPSIQLTEPNTARVV